MGSRYKNSKNQNHSSTEIKGEADKNDNGVAGAAVAGVAVAGAAVLAVWGLSKLFGRSKPEEKASSSSIVSKADKKDTGVSGAAVAVTAAWGLSKLIGSTEPEENYNMMMASPVSRDCDKLESSPMKPSLIMYDGDNKKWTSLSKKRKKKKKKWTKPENGWLKLNTDASVLPKKGHKASAGGLIRDHTGRWIVGFTASLKPCGSTSAELQAVREGLKLAWTRGLKKVIIETDSEQAVDLIENVKSENHSLGCIIEECRDLMKRDWNIELNHICREKNSCADALADMGMYQIEPLIILNETPANVQTLVSTDMIN